jgi:hypothetical protein
VSAELSTIVEIDQAGADKTTETIAIARCSMADVFETGTVREESGTVREAVGVFKRAEDLQSAIDSLLSGGFHRASLSLLASENAVREKLGHWYSQTSTLTDDAAVPRVAYVSPEAIGDAQGAVIGGLMYVGALAATGAVVASGGSLAALLLATTLAGGTGAFIGSELAKHIGQRHGRRLQEQLEHGGLVLWVRTWNRSEECKALKILRSHHAKATHVHGLPAPL